MYLIIALLIVVCVILFYPLSFYYFQNLYILNIPDINLAKRVYNWYNDEPDDMDGVSYYSKGKWSLFDLLMLSILSEQSFDIIFTPNWGVKLGDDKLFLNAATIDDGLKSADLLTQIDFAYRNRDKKQ